MWFTSGMWFEDLSPYSYFKSPPIEFGRKEELGWRNRTLNVGWLDGDQPYRTGNVPQAMVERLRELVEHAPTLLTRGSHFCGLCHRISEAERSRPHPLDHWSLGNGEIRIMGPDSTRYASPVLIYHYVTAHRYRPPDKFITAALYSRRVTWVQALENNLCLSCGSPFETGDLWRDMGFDESPPWLEGAFLCMGCETTFSRRVAKQRSQR